MKYFLIILSIICTSMYYFPFEFTFLKGVNTKHMMFGFGALCMMWDMILQRSISFSKELLFASLIAVLFSIVGLYSTDYNLTNDYSYATYIASMWMWLIACYGSCSIIRNTHGYISVTLIVNYLLIVCISQCVLALMIDFIPSFKRIVDSIFVTGDLAFMEKAKRLYGIGALLDVAGVRFASVLVMSAVILSDNKEVRSNSLTTLLYILAFITIAIVGNMISRTTSIGVLLGLLYIMYKSGLLSPTIRIIHLNFWKIFLSTMLFFIIVVTYLYQTNDEVYDLLRFAFEGFFNWVETGRWETDSTEVLKNMWILPDNNKTWIIGDGYFNNPLTGSFYKGTDVGYLRFIYYCGTIGLFFFCLYFIYLSYAIAKKFKNIEYMFILLLAIVFLNWAKVSTDIFLVYAFFLVLLQPTFKTFLKHNFQNV